MAEPHLTDAPRLILDSESGAFRPLLDVHSDRRGSLLIGLDRRLERVFYQFGQLVDQGRRASTRFWEVWELGARFFISSGSSGSRAGGLALGFGRFGAWSAFFYQFG